MFGTIKVVCAWCRRHLSGRDDAPEQPRGLCPLCHAGAKAEMLPDDVWRHWQDQNGGEGGGA